MESLDTTLSARLTEEVRQRLEEARAAEEALAKLQDAASDVVIVEEAARRLAACQRDIATFQAPLESTSGDAALAASVRVMLEGIRAAYVQRIEELSEELRVARGAAATRDQRIGALRRTIQGAEEWRTYNVEARGGAVRENILSQVDAHLGTFRPFAAWGGQRNALIAGLKSAMQLQDVMLDSRMAIFVATRDYFDSVATRKRSAADISTTA